MCRDLDFPGLWVGIFAKEPIPGKVKTRLCPPLTPVEAAQLYEASLRETVASMTRPGLPFRVVLCPAGDPAWFLKEFEGLPLLCQGKGDLGARMERVLRTLLSGGAEGAALVGSDTPDLPPEIVESSFRALRGVDAVFAPASDGGYVLVAESRHQPALFLDIPWSTPEVMETTRRRGREAEVVWREIDGWEDVDDLGSLQRLIERSPGSSTARVGAKILLPGENFRGECAAVEAPAGG